MFQLQYGPYVHQPGECKVSITRTAQVTALGTVPTVRESWSVWGRLLATDPNSVNALVATLEAAYTTQGLDVSLIGTNLGITSADTLGGIRVVKPPHFPDGDGAEGSMFRSYQIELEADVIVGGAETQLVSWQQTLTSSGGGPRFVFLPVLYGPPVQQITQQQTTYQVTQFGRAVGLLATPQPAAPLFPFAMHVDQSNIAFDSPIPYGTGVGQVNKNYGVSWSYFFESAGPLSGAGSVPNYFIPYVT